MSDTELLHGSVAPAGRHGHPDNGRLSGTSAADASTAMLMARNGHKSTPSLVRTPRCDADSFVTDVARKYKRTTTLGVDIGRYGERTSGERDNQTFGT